MQLLTCPWISHATLASYLGAGGRGTHKAGFRKCGEKKGSGKKYLTPLPTVCKKRPGSVAVGYG